IRPTIIALGSSDETEGSDALERRDVRQVAIEPVVVETVADHEHVRDREPDVIDGHLDLTPAGLVEQHARTHASRAPRLELPLECGQGRSEEHTSELQSPCNLVCRLLLEKKKK